MNLTRVFQEILNLSLMGTVLIFIVLAVRRVFKGRFSATWQYLVWFLVAIRLILFIAPQHPVSLYNLFTPVISQLEQKTNQNKTEEPAAAQTDNANTEQTKDNAAVPLNNDYTPEESTSKASTAPSLIDILAVIWLCGAALTALIIAISNAAFLRRLKKSKPCNDQATLLILEECYGIAGATARIPLYLSDHAKAPMLCGLAKPRLVLSEQVLEKLSAEEKRYVFLHELIHYKRKDILTNYIISFIKCIYWFNPFVFYAFHVMREDCELSCDERVLKLIKPSEYSSYGKTILNLIYLISVPHAYAGTTAMVQKKSSVKRRIYMIKQFKEKTILTTVIALAITLLVGCSALTNAKNFDSNTNASGGQPASQPTATVNPTEETTTPALDETSQETQTPAPKENTDATPNPETKDMTVEEKVTYYMDKLKDKSFTGTYGDGQTWYTAAEELGMIGKPAIPKLIERLDTKDDYERALALYALLLATQHENVKTFTQGEYINVNLDFDSNNHPDMVKAAKAWWDKYKSNF